MNLPPPKKLTIFLLFSFFDLVSILVPYSSFFCSIEAFCLSLPSYASRSTSSLLTPPLILPKTRSLVDLLIFCTFGATREEWKKIKCKGWNGREGPTFILSGPIELFPKIVTLFAKHWIGSWILIWAKHCSFLLDFENALLPKHDIDSLMPFSCSFSLDFKNMLLPKRGIGSLMPFPRSFSLDIVSMKRQKVPMDVRRRVLLSSINFPSTTSMTNSIA